MKTKRFLAAIGTLCALLLNVPAALAVTSTGFSDVPTSHPNAEAIADLKVRGVIGGYPDGTYKPDQAVNRVEALKIILLGSGITVAEMAGTGNFSDTDGNAWYAKFIIKALELGIVQGYPDGTFKPEQTVNLAENLKILLLAKDVDLGTVIVTQDPYADAFANEWYAKYVQYAKDKNLIDADGQNRVLPGQGMTRGKLAEVIYRLLYTQERGLESFPPPGSSQDGVVMDVSIEDFAFNKSSLTIGKGWKVRWTNKDSVVHTVTSDTGDVLDSANLSNGDIFEYTFTEEGTYTYHCAPHPNMKGTIIVKPANEIPTV